MFDPFSQQGAGELNVLKRHLQSTVLTLLDRNTSQREIHRLTGVDRKTIRRYQALRAGAEANSPGEVTTGSVSADGQIPPPRPPAFGTSEATVTSSLARSACEAHRTWIEEQVRLKRNAQAIYQDLVDQFGFPSSYQSVKRFVRRLRHADPEQFDRLEFLPGEEAQVDYGEGAPTVDPKSGRYRRPRLFVMTLRYSRRSFRRVVWKSSQQVWAQLHEEAFRYFGGVPSYVVLDNLKEGVLKPDLYEPQLNPDLQRDAGSLRRGRRSRARGRSKSERMRRECDSTYPGHCAGRTALRDAGGAKRVLEALGGELELWLILGDAA
ncbi:transposase [Bradyrhizobium japonicum]